MPIEQPAQSHGVEDRSLPDDEPICSRLDFITTRKNSEPIRSEFPFYRVPSILLIVADFYEIAEQANRVGVQFLKTEVSTATTFAVIALSSAPEDLDKKLRNRANARKGYDTAVHLLERLSLSEPESREIRERLEVLKSKLQLLGEGL